MKCCVCGKGMEEGVSLFRVNKKGVPGVWACSRRHAEAKGLPIDPEVEEIVALIEGGSDVP